jgi:hypothetical protein
LRAVSAVVIEVDAVPPFSPVPLHVSWPRLSKPPVRLVLPWFNWGFDLSDLSDDEAAPERQWVGLCLRPRDFARVWCEPGCSHGSRGGANVVNDDRLARASAEIAGFDSGRTEQGTPSGFSVWRQPDGGENWYDEMRRAGLHFGDEGRRVTVTEEFVATVLGRESAPLFRVEMATGDLWRLRSLLVGGGAEMHVPVVACFDAGAGGIAIRRRLIARTEPWCPLILDLTDWLLSSDSAESQLRSRTVLSLTHTEAFRLLRVIELWRANVRPLRHGPLYAAAGFSTADARNLMAVGLPTDDVEERLRVLAALREDAA